MIMRILRFLLLFFLLGPVTGLQARLRITEVLAYNFFNMLNPVTGQAGDWIEIHNESGSQEYLTAYFLSDNPDNLTKWKLPSDMVIPPGGYLLIFAHGEENEVDELHANFALDVSGETVYLYSAVNGVVDSLAYPRMYENISYGLLADGRYAFFNEPTPGSDNDEASAFRMAGPVRFDPPGGIFTGSQIVKLYGEPGATIRYSIDGSEPDLSNAVYSNQMLISKTMVIRARQWVDGEEPSEVTTASFIYHDNYDMPTISLSTNPDNLWDDEIGIHVTGTNGIPGYCSDYPRNWNQDWERPVSFEYFDVSGTRQVYFDGGFKIHGGCSRQANLKSFGIFARSEYGSNSINYPFFRQKDGVDWFKGLVLRNAGNDNQYTFIRDAVIQSTVSPDMDIDFQAYEPVQVFLNGEYWGMMNLREKVNEHWVTSNYGIPADNLDFLKNFTEIFAGSDAAFQSLMDYIEGNSLTVESNYAYVADRLDINSYIDYLITEMFFANRDWPGNNQKYWRDRVNGSKWRFILFDMEFSMGLYEFDPTIDMFSFSTDPAGPGWPNPPYATLPIRKLLENQGFREEFLKKYMMYLNTTLSTENVVRVIDSLYYNIYDAMPAHIDRWHLISSMNAWNNQVELIRRFARERPGNVWQNMSNFFSLGSPVDLRFEASGTRGEILANGISVPRNGMEATYLSGSDLDLEFMPAPGYRLKHWEVSGAASFDTLMLPRESVWKYNDSGMDLGTDWKEPGYNDAAWPQGNGELGYGDGGESTVLDFGPDSENKYTTYYFRTTLEIPDPSSCDNYILRIMRDDGAVVYFNGQEALRDNMPEGTILSTTFSLDFAGDADEYTYFEFGVDGALFVPGTNTIAVEIHQNSLTSSDISFDLELQATRYSGNGTWLVQDNPLNLTVQGGEVITPVTEIDERDLELYINEFMSSNQGAYFDEYGNDADWIEIFNADDSDADLAGLFLTDNLDNPAKWRIPFGSPEETTVEAGGYRVLFADGHPGLGPLHLDLRLNTSGEEVGLSYMSGENVVWLDSIRFRTLYSNISAGRYPDGTDNWVTMPAYTPGASNIYTGSEALPGQAMEISIFPNPAYDHLNMRAVFEGSVLPDEALIRVFDLTGRKVLSQTAPCYGGLMEELLDISSLESGIYIVEVRTGTLIHTTRFIKTGG
jgi:hypothetical protein